jgi:glycerol-1-phosphate dehydrogenase [NAD(P)+]
MSARDIVTTDDLEGLRAELRGSPEAATFRGIGVREVIRGAGAIQELANLTARLGIEKNAVVTVISDTTHKRYLNTDVLSAVLNVLGAQHVLYLISVAEDPSLGTVIADELTLDTTVAGVRRTAPRAIVSVGSGTIVDIGKVVARDLAITHVVVQTAASVNGFADDQSVLLVKGVKRTTPSRWPDAIVIDSDAISQAPLAMGRSGLGDQLSMFSAAADWYLSHAIGFDDSFSPTLVELMRRDLDELVKVSRDLGRGEPEALDVLTTCLTLGGLAMGVAGRTAPSSGSEHLISHLLEMHADAFHTPSASHGSQVGAASVTAALIWQRVRERLRSGDARVDMRNIGTREQVFAAFGHLDTTGETAQECWANYEAKSTWIALHLDDIRRVLREWADHDETLEQLLRPADFVASLLHDAQASVSFEQLDPAPPPEAVTWAIANGHLMRDRFSVLDLAVLIGAWSPDDVRKVLSEQSELAP